MTDIDIAELERLVSKLQDHTKLRYMGDCKCGKCQLVPLNLLNEAIVALAALKPGATGGEKADG